MSDSEQGGLEQRAPGSSLRYWLLLDANRYGLAGGLLAGIFASLVVIGAFDPTPLAEVIGSTSTVQYTFQALLMAIVTSVTLVITVNQLVLSQELGAVGDQRERMTGAREFRETVETVIADPVSPANPATFMGAILDAIGETAGELQARAPDDRVADYAAEVARDAGRVQGELEGSEFGSYELLGATLDFDYSSRLYQVQRLRVDLEGDADAVAGRLVHALELYGPAREHFKTLYFQWELINLSRAMLYAAVPALVVTAGTTLYVDLPGTITGSTLGVANLIWYVSAAVTVALAPFFLLLAYILRIATVAKRTLAMGPFVLRSTGSTAGFGSSED